MNGIELGPVVGHTDHQSTRIWIKVFDDPRSYKLKVAGVGTFDFVSAPSPSRLGRGRAVRVPFAARA